MGKFLHKSDKKMASSVNLTMRDAIIAAAGERGWNDTRDSWLTRAARVLGLSPRKARSLFYGTPASVSAEEIITAAAFLAAKQEREERAHEIRGDMARLLSVVTRDGGTGPAQVG